MELHLKGPMPAPPPPVDEKQRAGEQDGGKGRIRCPHCSWTPRRTDLWACRCGCQWHTFDTAGQCPDCHHRWTDTQCLKCYGWSAHAAWYDSGGNPLN